MTPKVMQMRLKAIAMGLLVLVLFAGSACTKVYVSVRQAGLSSGLTGTNCKLKRELRNQKQETDFWCWAASAHTVLAYIKQEDSMKQCDLLNVAVGLEPKATDPNSLDCCKANYVSTDPVSTTGLATTLDPASTDVCWVNGWPEQVFDRLPFKVLYDPPVKFDPAFQGPQGLEWHEIVTEICEDRPVITAVAFSGPGAGAHTVVIGGYKEMDDGTQWVQVYDPGYSTLEEDYYVWSYEMYLGDPGVYTHIRDYKNISIP
jgi:hypothetical protein